MQLYHLPFTCPAGRMHAPLAPAPTPAPLRLLPLLPLLLLLTASLSGSSALAATTIAADTSANGGNCLDMAAPLDDSMDAWMMTLYAPPPVLPALLFPGSEEAAALEDLLESSPAWGTAVPGWSLQDSPLYVNM